MSLRSNYTYRGSNITDNSCNAQRTRKKVYNQYKTNNSNNAPGPHISDTASSFCPSLPSLHENETNLNQMEMNFFQDCIRQIPEFSLGILSNITDAILNQPLHINQSQAFTIYPHPTIDVLEPILCHMGFTHMAAADASGKRPFVLQNKSKAMRSIVYVADILKPQSMKVTNEKNNCSDSEFGGSSYSSSFCLSTYSCEKRAAKKPMQENVNNHNGHNHGDNSTCYSGYSSAGFNESQLTAIKVQMGFGAAIEVKMDEYWRFLRPQGTSNSMPRDGTYSFVAIDKEIQVEVTYQSKSRTASLSALIQLDLIRIPNKNHSWL